MLGSLIGASLTGLRPVMDFMFASFFYVAMDQIANQAARIRYMSGGQVSLPIVLLGGVGPQGQAGSQHSESPHATLMGLGGLKVVLPSTACRREGIDDLLDPRPQPGCLLDGHLPLGHPGRDLALRPRCATGVRRREAGGRGRHGGGARFRRSAGRWPRPPSWRAGRSVEVVDPRTLVPLDLSTILTSVRKTGRSWSPIRVARPAASPPR